MAAEMGVEGGVDRVVDSELRGWRVAPSQILPCHLSRVSASPVSCDARDHDNHPK